MGKNKAWDALVNPKSDVGNDFDQWAREHGYSESTYAGKYEKDTGVPVNSGSAFDWSTGTRKSYIGAEQLYAMYENQATGYNGSAGGGSSGSGGDRGAGGAQAPVTVNGLPAPGQDAYSQKMLTMSTGKYDASDPSYLWRFNEGQRALERSAAAKGQLGSGNVMQELVGYGQGMASTEYAAEFDRMMRAAGLVTTQYDSAIKALASMANIDYNKGMLGVANRNADANMVSAQASGINASTNSRQQRFGEDLQAGKDAAGRDALYQMYSQPTQQSVSQPETRYVSTQYVPAGTASAEYSGSRNGTDSLGNSYSGGSWSSSSGGGGKWSNGSYSGD